MSTQQTGSNQILTLDGLLEQTVQIFTGNGEKPTEKKMGIEVEMPFVTKKNLEPITFSGPKSISAIFNVLAKKCGWETDTIENGHVTSLKGESGSITLEPGGQIEFSSAPRTSLGQLAADVKSYTENLDVVSKKLGVDVLPFGFHPHVAIEEIPYISERTRFAALKPVFEAENGYAAWGQSSSVQLTLDGKCMDDSFAAFKLGLQLQPLAAAMFANSPFSKGEDSGFKTWRRENLLALDSPLYNVPKNIYDDSYTLKDWAQHVLNVPMSFVVRNDEYLAVAPKPFIEMIGKPLPELAHLPVEEQYLTGKDLVDHTTGIKPEMLLKPNQLLEFRAADLGPTPQHWMALGAFWTGIFYDKDSFKAVQEYVSEWTNDERASFRSSVAKDGLATEIHGKTAQQVALDLIEISKQGLAKIEPAAVKMLEVLEDQVKLGITPADVALKNLADNKGDFTATMKESLLFSGKKANKGGLSL
ncbi:MAG: glutamate-cysteine ligase family protein [Micavibrio sp.]|nr:glutamate-cysteine ligase family protein [Micavibrio sp.]